MTLAFEHLSLRTSGREILCDVDLQLMPGEVTVILGPNGAGKSSLIGCAAALRKPSAGRVTLDGQDVARMKPQTRARRIGYLPQSAEVHWNLPGGEVVALGRLPHRSAFSGAGETDRAAIARAVEATDTAAFMHRPVLRLSGGERARVLLARVLAGEPDWLLADEPLASLDPSHQIDILDRLRQVAAGGAGVVLVLHDLSQAARVADRIILIKQGRLIAVGKPDEVLRADILRETYGVDVHIARTPGGEPILVPLRRAEG